VTVPEQAASTQHVYVSSSTKSEDGTQETVVISYKADDSTTTGLGLRVHFDSSQLSLSDISGILSTDNLVTPTLDDINTDTDNLDNDVNTDSYVNIGWASLFGTWPGAESAELATLVFDIAEDATGSSAINLAASSNAAGFTFDGQSHEVAISNAAEIIDEEPAEDDSPISSQLSINSDTGEVSLAVDPDYETESEYNFSVVATDAAGNQSDVQEVTVTVDNLDEIAPVITSTDTVAIDENSGAGQVIYTATADDSADISEGVTFSLSSDSDSALSIDATTGQVTLAVDPDHEAQSEYNFTVLASDGVNSPSEQLVTLTVNNLDEIAPTITSSATADAIDENSGAGQVIYTATADDSADISEGVTFSLSSDSDSALSIDAATGEVTLANNPDHETQTQYSFAVIATDAAGNSSAPQSVTMGINDLDEVAPVINSGSGSSIDENSGIDQVIYTATADDSADVSEGVTYSLVDGTNYGDNNDEPVDSGPIDTGPIDTGPLVSDVTVPEQAASTQHVYVSSSTKSEDGTQETVVISYKADDSTTTGLGLRVHFDSSQLSLSDISGILSTDSLVTPTLDDINTDTDNLDNDVNTDSYVNIGWASLFGTWPGAESAELATLVFDIAEDATGSSAINLAASSNAAGFTFDGQSHEVAISTEVEAETENSDSLVEETQYLSISDSVVSEDSTQASVVVSYNALEDETTGLGLRIHFDSDVLSFSTLSDVLAKDIVFANTEATIDDQDFDNNPLTDMFVDAGWASLYGDWPNESLPTDLLTLNFDIVSADADAFGSRSIGY
jgi:hypothetical protein